MEIGSEGEVSPSKSNEQVRGSEPTSGDTDEELHGLSPLKAPSLHPEVSVMPPKEAQKISPFSSTVVGGNLAEH